MARIRTVLSACLTATLIAGLSAPVTPASAGSPAAAVDRPEEHLQSVDIPELPDPVDPAETDDVAAVEPAGEVEGGVGWSDPGGEWAAVTEDPEADELGSGDGMDGPDENSAADGPGVGSVVKLRGHRGNGTDIGDTETQHPQPGGPVGIEMRPKGRGTSGQVWLRFGAWDTDGTEEVDPEPSPTSPSDPTPTEPTEPTPTEPTPSDPTPTEPPFSDPSPSGPAPSCDPTANPSDGPGNSGNAPGHNKDCGHAATPHGRFAPAALRSGGNGGWAENGVDPHVLDARVSYADLERAFGADWSSRLQVTAYPACFWDTPDDPVCAQGDLIGSVLDPETQTLTFSTREKVGHGRKVGQQGRGEGWRGSAGSAGARSMSAVAAVPMKGNPHGGGKGGPKGGGSTYVVSADTAGTEGNYGANPVAGSSSWQVGTGTGEFSYSYPFGVPAAVAGAAPGLGLSYSSGSVDGMTTAENGQAGLAGLGWDLGSSFISREFTSCSKDAPRWKFKGDLCWKSDHRKRPVQRLSLVLAGRSSTLVRVGSSNEYRLLDDPGWRVTLISGRSGTGSGGAAKSPDNDAERFEVRTPEGARYRFGFRPAAQSTWVVPVYANSKGEPCFTRRKVDSWCQQAWRWNLDTVLDKDGNRTDYSYTRESGYYDRYANRSSKFRTRYDRSGYLSRISYGLPASGGRPRAEVFLSTAPRCVPALRNPSRTCTGAESPRSKPSIWPDVPTDLMCAPTGDCDAGSPSFFTTRRYQRITTQVRRVTSLPVAPAGVQKADSYTLKYTMPDPDGGDPTKGPGLASLWLNEIVRTGYAPSGAAKTLPPIKFDGVWKRNRIVVPTSKKGVGRPFMKLRIGSVRNETGGRTDVGTGTRPTTPARRPTRTD